MSSYFQESSPSLSSSVAASSAFNWQALQNHHHQLQQQQMNLQPNADIFHPHYTNLYGNQGYHTNQSQTKYSNHNYVPHSGLSHESFLPSSSSIPSILNNHGPSLDTLPQYLTSSSTTSTSANTNNSIIHPSHGSDESKTTSTAATNNNVTNNCMELSNKRNYSTTSHEVPLSSLASLTCGKSSTGNIPTTSSNSLDTSLTESPLSQKLDSSNIQAAQTAAAAAAAVAAYNTPNPSLLDGNASESYASRMNLGYPYGGVQSMPSVGVTNTTLGDPNAAAMAAVHAAATTQGCYDMYAAASMASKNSSFYPWMKNYPGKCNCNYTLKNYQF